MITDAFLELIFGAARAVVGLIPDWAPPSFVADIAGKASDLGGMASGYSSWVPWPVAITVAGVIVTTYATINVTRFSLWLWHKLPVVGK